MKISAVSGVVLCACLALTFSACSDSYESLTEEAIDLMDEMATTLDSIDGPESGKAVVAKMEKLGKKGEDLKKRMDAMEKPSDELEKKLEEKYKDQMKKVMERIMKAAPKTATLSPEDQKAIEKAMSSMGGLR